MRIKKIISRPINRESKTSILINRYSLNVFSNSPNITHYSEVKENSDATLG